jgi:hypothetical protein
MLRMPHIAPLCRYAATLREEGRGSVPEFDPMDGGINARALFLFEKPGPMTDESRSGGRMGSGFISRDNDDRTAEATFRFMKEAGIPRRLTITWNIVPWWNGTRTISRVELQDGVRALAGLITLLPELRAIVLVGRKAARASALLQCRGIRHFESAHPSPIVRASRPELWKSIPHQWTEIVPLLR